ncbi:MAG: NUDIX hydrolase [Longimicrobiales bacterium]
MIDEKYAAPSDESRASAPDMVIPIERLPPGFAQQVESPPKPAAAALPASTVVLMRDAEPGPEVLLLRRSRDSGFVPGAYVFPGGRVDDSDADLSLRNRIDGLPADVVPGVASNENVPGSAYWIAAAREVFEETGILLAHNPKPATRNPQPDVIDTWRDRLLEDHATLLDVLCALDARLDLGEMVYCAHWITPVAERRRYDTRFFLARVTYGHVVRLDAREMTDALWLTPRDALDRFADGALPMVFPTVKTLESLASFTQVAQALDTFRERRIEPVLPRLVRTAAGVGIVVDRAAGRGD